MRKRERSLSWKENPHLFYKPALLAQMNRRTVQCPQELVYRFVANRYSFTKLDTSPNISKVLTLQGIGMNYSYK